MIMVAPDTITAASLKKRSFPLVVSQTVAPRIAPSMTVTGSSIERFSQLQ